MFHRHKWSKWTDVPTHSMIWLWQRKRCAECGKVKERLA